MKTTLLSIIASSLLLVGAVQGQIITNFIGEVTPHADRLSRLGNWDNGLPLIADGKVGIISTATWGPTTTAARLNDVVIGQHITQISGRVYADANRTFGGNTVWNLQGGEMDWQTFTLNNVANDGYTLNMSGGVLTAARINAYTASVLNLSGGSMTVGRADWAGGEINFLAGNAIVTVTGIDAIATNAVIDFSPLASGSLTVASLDQTGFESLWSSSTLRFDGANSGNFADHFLVSGNTLTVVPVPEASTYAALLGGLALVFVAARRRRQ